jgi:uncharacterized Ntn-hydrolase superfamily protein
VTLSIVARDAETGQLGVAVQTAMFAAGAVVPWARPGVGAVASQAISESAYGPRCLDALERGCTATEALAEAEAADPMAVLRQVGVVGADGSAAAMTGAFCIEPAGHVVGDGFTVQANMTTSPDVWPAMAASFRSSGGPLARRLYEALVAGAAAGGDARGVMSAALLVVEGRPPETPGGGKSPTCASTGARIRSPSSRACSMPRMPTPASVTRSSGSWPVTPTARW